MSENGTFRPVNTRRYKLYAYVGEAGTSTGTRVRPRSGYKPNENRGVGIPGVAQLEGGWYDE
eukprot:36372-Rhodomonas_salina.2